MKLEPGTAWSEITELPTKPRGSWQFQLIEKAIRLWYVSFFVLCCQSAFFATSMFERASLLFFSMLTREFVLFQEIVLLKMATFREGWFAGRRHSQTLLLKPKSATISVKSLQLRRNSVEQWQMDENLNYYITNLSTRNYQVLHLAYNPQPAASGCMLGL